MHPIGRLLNLIVYIILPEKNTLTIIVFLKNSIYVQNVIFMFFSGFFSVTNLIASVLCVHVFLLEI